MASVVTTKAAPYSGLCKFCLNLRKVQKYAPDTDEQEGLAHYACSAIPELIFSIDKRDDRYYIGSTTISDEGGNLTDIVNNISNCNQYLMGAAMVITNVSYDLATTTLTIDYTLDNVVGTPDLDFYYIGNTASVKNIPTVTDGSATTTIVAALPDGDYYLWMQLTTGEKSNIYPFNLQTIV